MSDDQSPSSYGRWYAVGKSENIRELLSGARAMKVKQHRCDMHRAWLEAWRDLDGCALFELPALVDYRKSISRMIIII